MKKIKMFYLTVAGVEKVGAIFISGNFLHQGTSSYPENNYTCFES